jgi:phage-related protein
MSLFGKSVALMKFPAIIAGASAAITAINSLGAGVIALSAALAPAAGGVVTLGQAFVSVKQAQGVFKLGIQGVSDALKEVTKDLQKPTPAAKQFARYLQTFIPQFKQLRDTAQKPILAGLTVGLDRAKTIFPILNKVIGDTAAVIGHLAASVGSFVSRNGTALGAFGTENARLLGSLGKIVLNVASAFLTVANAARPLSNWLAKIAVGLSKGLSDWTKSEQRSGGLKSFFTDAQISIKHLLSIVGALGVTFKNIFGQGKDLGFDMLRSIDNITESWAKWSSSVEGKNAIKKWFDDARPILHQTWLLIRDIAHDFAGFADQPGVDKIIGQLRTQLLPVLVNILKASGQSNFLSQLIKTISDLGTAITPLIGPASPLTLLLQGFDLLAKGLIAVQQAVPGSAAAFGVLGSSLSVMSAIGLSAGISELFGFKKGLSSVKDAALALNKVFPLLITETEGEAVAIKGLNVALLTNPFVLAAAAIVALGAAFYEAYKHSETFRNIVNEVVGALKTAFTATVNWVKTAFTNVVNWVSTAVQNVITEVSKWKVLIAIVKTYVTILVDYWKVEWLVLSTAVKLVFATIKAIVTTGINELGPVIKAGLQIIVPVVKAVWGVISGIFQGAWTEIKGIVTGGLQIIKGVIEIFEGIFRGDFSRVWQGIQDIFKGAFKALKGIMEGQVQALGKVAGAIGDGITGALKGALNGAAGVVAGLVNSIIDVINILPGVNIKHVSIGAKKTAAGNNGSALTNKTNNQNNHPGLAKGGNWGRGGQVTSPTIIMGEEAPQHPEWVIPENPAYRKRALMLWATAGKRIGAYAQGGKIEAYKHGGIIGAVVNGVKDVASLGVNGVKGMLPHNPLTGWAAGLGSYVLRAVGGWIGKQASNLFGGGGSGGGATKGPNGVGTFNGIPMADWVIDALKYAQSKGVTVRPTSGYRPGPDPHTATGASEHQGTQYPHGAVDFGGYHDPAALAMKMAVVHATAGYKYPLLAPQGFVDDGHASGTGHRMGGMIGPGAIAFASGGVYSRTQLMQLWDQEGGAPGAANVAAAVALAESSGSATASNTNKDGTIDRGLWQINSSHGSLSTFDVAGNTKAAIKISSDGRNWTPWTTYRTGAYKKFMGANIKPPKGATGSTNISIGGTTAPKTSPNIGVGTYDPSRPNVAVGAGNASSTTGGTRYNSLLPTTALAQLGFQNAQISARDQYGPIAGSTAVDSTVPTDLSRNLDQQETLLLQAYKTAVANINRLQAKRKKTGLGKQGQQKLTDAYGNAQTALQNLTQIKQTIEDVNAQYAGPSPEDQLNAQIAEGQVTGNIQQQVDGFKKMVDLKEQEYQAAVKAGKPQDIITAAQALVQARSDLQQILQDTAGPTELDRANAALAQAQLTPAIQDDIQALTQLDQLYYNAYQAALQGGDPRQIQQAAQDYASAHQALQQATPTAMDYANAHLAQAQLTDDWHDDITALTEIDKAAYDAYQEALQGDDPKAIASAAQEYQQAHQQLQDATPSALDYANAAIAQAALTEDVADDIKAATDFLDLMQQAYDKAVASGDPRQIAQAAQDLKNAQDNLKNLENSGMPTAISFGNQIDPGVLAALGVSSPAGTIGGVTVQQYFQKAPDDPYAYLRSSSFAAQGVFGGT